MNLDDARKILPLARELSALIADDYTESYDTKAGRAEICISDPATGEVSPIAALLPDCGYDDRRFLSSAPTLMRGLLVILDAAFDRIRSLDAAAKEKDRQTRKPSLAEDCAKLCNKAAFRRFLRDRHGVDIADGNRVATRVRSMLAIQSRSVLDEDPSAAARWYDLRAEYEAWRRA